MKDIWSRVWSLAALVIFGRGGKEENIPNESKLKKIGVKDSVRYCTENTYYDNKFS